MELPKFLIADNSEFPEKIFILHTEYPRFLLDVENEDVEFFEELNEEDSDAVFEEEMTALVEQAYVFFDREMDLYDEADDID
ncbi:hypothetical protein ACF3NR_00010 [Vaginella massiliensis]|uniref:hypothetical protein n=1 Tax=Vaginella massiliensis TaxID=1816680 RepID=UPI0008395EA8|nr:hypothetical protein [Vaginella massiliensis]